MRSEFLKPLILRGIAVLVTMFLLPLLAKLQAAGVIAADDTATIVAGVTAAALAVVWFVYQKIVSLAIQKVALALPAATDSTELQLAQAKVAQAVKQESLAGKLEIIRTGAITGSGVTSGRTRKAFDVAAALAGMFRRD